MAGGFVEGAGDEVHGEETEGAAHEADPAAELVDDGGGDDGADDADGVEAAGEAVLRQCRVPGCFEEDGRVGRHGRDARPGGHDLQPDAQPGATAEVLVDGRVRAAGEDLGEVEGRAGFHVLGQGEDLEVLGFDVFAFAAADVDEDLAGFFVAADGGEVPRGVREHLDTGEEQQGGDALEAEEEAPADDGVAVADEGEAEGEPVGDGDAEVVRDEDVAEEAAAVVGGGHFGDEDGGDAGEGAGAEAGDDAGDEDEVGGLGRGLEGAADEGEEGADEEAVDAADAVGEPAADEAADYGAEVVLWMCQHIYRQGGTEGERRRRGR